MSIRTALKKLVDIIFPYIPRCVVCGVEKRVDAYLCPDCAAELELRRAGASVAGAFAAYSAFEYNGSVAKLVQRYKYGGDKWLRKFMADAIIETVDISAVDAVCHVPLHDRRRKSRGFDQASELAQSIAAQTGKPYVAALRRVRNTPTQTKLNTQQRQENMRGAFESACPVSGSVLLVDDVLTTGATAAECASALVAAGAASVTVATFARAEME